MNFRLEITNIGKKAITGQLSKVKNFNDCPQVWCYQHHQYSPDLGIDAEYLEVPLKFMKQGQVGHNGRRVPDDNLN